MVRTGPISFNRFWGSTGTADMASLLSAPSLCFRVIKSIISTEKKSGTYVQDSINENVNAILSCHLASFKKLPSRSPPRWYGTFLVEFTQVPLSDIDVSCAAAVNNVKPALPSRMRHNRGPSMISTSVKGRSTNQKTSRERPLYSEAESTLVWNPFLINEPFRLRDASTSSILRGGYPTWKTATKIRKRVKKSRLEVQFCRRLAMRGLLGLSSGPSRMWSNAAGVGRKICKIWSIHENMIGSYWGWYSG